MWKTLEAIDQRITQLRGRVERATRPAPASGRELFTVLFQEVSFLEDNLAEQRQTYYNGDRDTLVIQRLGVSVSYSLAASPTVRRTMQRTTTGWGVVGTLTGAEGIVAPAFFDFQWNYVVNSRQSVYGRQPSMSDMLVGLDKGQMLDFRVPLTIPPSESVEFRVQPLRYRFPDDEEKVAGTTYFVGFIGLGYRSVL